MVSSKNKIDPVSVYFFTSLLLQQNISAELYFHLHSQHFSWVHFQVNVLREGLWEEFVNPSVS